MKAPATTMVICVKDIMKITGRSKRTACRINKDIRQRHKAKYITLEAFCHYIRVAEETILEMLR